MILHMISKRLAGKYNEERLLRNVIQGIVDINLFLLFTIIDGYTPSKQAEAVQAPVRWFVKEVEEHRVVSAAVRSALLEFGL